MSGKIFNYPSFSNKCEKFFFSIRFDTFFEFLGLKSSTSMCDLQPTMSIKLKLHPHFCPQLETLKLLSPFNFNSNDVHKIKEIEINDKTHSFVILQSLKMSI